MCRRRGGWLVSCLGVLVVLCWTRWAHPQEPEPLGPSHAKRIQQGFVEPPPQDVLVSENGTLRWVGLLGDRRFRHGMGSGAMDISPDGKCIVSAGIQGVKVWEAATGRELRTFWKSEDAVCALAFSPNGKWVVAANRSGHLKTWDPYAGEELRTLSRQAGSIRSLAVTRNSKRIVSGGLDGYVKLWSAGTGKLIRSDETGTSIQGLALSPDGKRLVTVGRNHLEVRSMSSWKGRSMKELTPGADLKTVAYGPDGRWFVVGGRGGRWLDVLRIWSVKTRQEQLELVGAEGWIQAVAVSPDGQRILSTRQDNKLRVQTLSVWDAATGEELQVIPAPPDGLRDVAFAPDGTWFAASCFTSVRTWDTATGKERLPLTGHVSLASSLAATGDGTRIVSGSYDGSICVWEAGTGKLVRTIESPEPGAGRNVAKCKCLAVSPDGTWLVAARPNKTLVLYDTSSGEELHTLTGHGSYAFDVAVSPDGKTIASAGCYDKTARIWDAATGTERVVLTGHGRAVRAVAVSPDGKYVVTGSDDNTLKLWATATGALIRTYGVAAAAPDPAGRRRPPPLTMSDVAFGPEGAWIVSLKRDGELKVWSTTSGEVLWTQAAHERWGSSIAVSPDGKWIASGGGNGVLKIWDAASGEECDSMQVDSMTYHSMCFVGNRIWMACMNSTICAYEHEPTPKTD